MKNMICNEANDYGFRRLRKILYVDKIVDFNFDSCSVLKKLETMHTVLHDCHRESPECKLVSQDRLGTLV